MGRKLKCGKRRKRRTILLFVFLIGLMFAFPILKNELTVLKYQKTISANGLPWNLVLVNRWNPISEDYKISLIEIEGSAGEKVDERIYPYLMEMLEAADEEGFEPVVVSGYRTQEVQQSLYDEKYRHFIWEGYSQKEAEKLTDQWVALPGTSEHQIGLAVDINGNSYEIYPWLEENCYKYGFVRRYTGEKEAITGIMDEPWHFRYVGEEAAKEILS